LSGAEQTPGQREKTLLVALVQELQGFARAGLQVLDQLLIVPHVNPRRAPRHKRSS